MSSSRTRESPAGTASDAGDPGGPTDRAQSLPVVALVALFVVCAGVSLYATVLSGSVPVEDERRVAGPTLDRVANAAGDGGVVVPHRLGDARGRAPDGRRVNLTLRTDSREWSVGPAVPSGAADRASRLVSVRLGPGRVEPGRLSAAVWS